ncbi:MAG: class II fructose-bisphosphate aldolase family protein [Actinobacteria bacterium]|nr:class II fructose-bisphosphate aldolase family protein [Actinomycetota bacterium]
MGLINLKNLLNNAKQNKYAVGAFAITNMDFIDTLIDCALKKNSPIILLLAEAHFKYLDIERVAPVIIDAAKKVNIPVCISLDHGQKLETIVKAIRCGFASVMFDGSKYPLKENINLTREVVRVAHSVDVSVEAELGYIGGESASEKMPESHAPKKELYTKVGEAIKFYSETNVDALAVAIGNVHGIYKGKPNLDFDRLKNIRDALDIPLVLHGGSGISDEDYKKIIELGICKINYYTDMSISAVDEIRNYLGNNPDFNSYPDLIKKAMLAVKKLVCKRFDVWGCTNKSAATKSLCISCDDEMCKLTDPMFSPDARTIVLEDLIEKISGEILKRI